MLTNTDEKIQTTPAHELAEIFPLHDDKTLQGLTDDIRTQGQLEDIFLYQGKILDGRRREIACIRIGIQPRFCEFFGDEDEALALVVSKNLHRRHLSESERAMVASLLATRKSGQRRGGSLTQSEAADVMNVSRRSVQRARLVSQSCAPELVEAVKRGDVKLTQAEAVSLKPAAVQIQALEAVKSGKDKSLVDAAERLSIGDKKHTHRFESNSRPTTEVGWNQRAIAASDGDLSDMLAEILAQRDRPFEVLSQTETKLRALVAKRPTRSMRTA